MISISINHIFALPNCAVLQCTSGPISSSGTRRSTLSSSCCLSQRTLPGADVDYERSRSNVNVKIDIPNPHPLSRLTLTTFRWLQPLDIAFNLVFKRVLKEIAAKWLAKNMAEQLKMNGGDPSRVKLDIGLKVMKPLFVIWFCAALQAMTSARNVAHNLKGWDISNMSKAFLPEHQHPASVEYLKAEEMADNGTLFANITGKSKGGANADAIMLEGNLTLTLIIQPISNPDPDCSVQRARLRC